MTLDNKNIKKCIFITWIIGTLLCLVMMSLASSADKNPTIKQTNYVGLPLSQPRTYYNATLIIISHTYYVRHFDGGKIDLGYQVPTLPGIFIVEDKNGIQECNPFGGWGGSRVEIYGFDGLFKPQGFYIALIGNCTEISIIPIRGIY